MGAAETLSIDKKRFNMLLKKLKVLDVRESKERVKLKRAIFRMCYEKNKDPEDVDQDLPLFLSTKTEDKWLEKVLGIFMMMKMKFLLLYGQKGRIIIKDHF
jgi:hypothetical protein